jgi:hypothetical protein
MKRKYYYFIVECKRLKVSVAIRQSIKKLSHVKCSPVFDSITKASRRNTHKD